MLTSWLHKNSASKLRSSSVRTPLHSHLYAHYLLGAALSGLALVGGIVYVILDYAADKEMAKYQEEEAPADTGINFKIWESIPRSPDFWVLSLLTVIYYAAIFPFQSLATYAPAA